MSCSDDRAKSMQFVVTATSVVASMTFCQLPMPAARLQPGHVSTHAHKTDIPAGVTRGKMGVWTSHRRLLPTAVRANRGRKANKTNTDLRFAICR